MTIERWSKLISEVHSGAPLLNSPFHGERHWIRVAVAGMAICSIVSEADPLVVALFALMHDCRRLDEGFDPDHGPRAADLVCHLFELSVLPISPVQAQLLQQASAGHSWARYSDVTGAKPRAGSTQDSHLVEFAAGS